VHQMLNRTGLDVMKETKNGQVPWISSTPIEEYYLAKGSTVVDMPQPSQPKNVSQQGVISIKNEQKRLEQERLELERLKIKLEKKKLTAQLSQIEPNKNINKEKTTLMASINHAENKPTIIATDGNYVKYSNGVVYDKNNDLEWYAGPDRNMTHTKAQAWLKKLNAKDSGWKLPSIYRLRQLYMKKPRELNRSTLFDCNSRYLWSKELNASNTTEAHCLDFYYKKQIYRYRNDLCGVFAVRVKK